MKEAEMRKIGEMIAAVIHEPESQQVKDRVRGEVADLTAQFPMYPQRLKMKTGEGIPAG
jgi:glycine hydroxymethyltransferase